MSSKRVNCHSRRKFKIFEQCVGDAETDIVFVLVGTESEDLFGNF